MKGILVFIITLVSYIGSPVIDAAPASGGGKPNILYIFTDDQSTRSVSCYQEARPWVKTPHIDKLADSGMRFTTCYTGAWCQPSRVSALTGLLQHAAKTVRVTDYPMAEYDPGQLPFFPSVMRKHGYQTACIGKWHLGEDVGHGRDWDYSVIWDRGGGRRDVGAYYHNTLVRTNGCERKPLGGYSTDRFTELAVEYIKTKKGGDKPWYLWLCYGGVHSPFTPAERHETIYANAPPAAIPADIFGPRPDKPEHLKNMTRWKKDPDGRPKGYDSAVKQYHRAVKSLDDGVGALVTALKESGQLENTVIIFTSDQGYAWGQHGSKEKWLAYDANICAPLIFSAPGRIKPGTVCKQAVNGLDIVSTIHALTGVEPEWKMHGRDLTALLDNPDDTLGQPMLMMNTGIQYGEGVTQNLKAQNYDAFKFAHFYPWLMMRDGKYKYIRHLQANAIEELYDMERDPDELRNLAVNPDYHKKLSELRLKAVKEFQEKDGDFTAHLPQPRIQHQLEQEQ